MEQEQGSRDNHMMKNQQARHKDSIQDSVADGGTTLCQHRTNVWSLLGKPFCYIMLISLEASHYTI